MMARRPVLAVGLACLAALCLAGITAFLLLGSRETQSGMAETRIGSVVLRYRSDYARFAAGREGGEQQRLDLAASFPGLAPAGIVTRLQHPSDAQDRLDRTIFLRLRPAEATLDPADRPMKLYARFFETKIENGPGGLVLRRFATGSPYETGELFIAPPEGRAFFAFCSGPSAKPDGLPDTCIHDFRSRGLDVEIRFSSKRLADWEPLITGTREFIDRLRLN